MLKTHKGRKRSKATAEEIDLRRLTDKDVKRLKAQFEQEKNATEMPNITIGNPPNWVANERKWDKAKRASRKALGSINWGFVVWFYLNKLDGRKK